MGVNTRLGNRSKREDLKDAAEAHNDNRKVIGFAAAGSAIVSAVFAFKYGVDSAGAMVFAGGTFFGGVATTAEAMDYSDAYRELTVLESPS